MSYTDKSPHRASYIHSSTIKQHKQSKKSPQPLSRASSTTTQTSPPFEIFLTILSLFRFCWGEKIKNGNVSITHTYDEETGEVLTTTYGTGTSKSVYEAQIEKIISEKILVNSQTTELARSVKFNNQIKALDSYADMIGTMGAGGLVVSVSMWKTLKSMIKSLNDGTTTVTYPADDDEFTIVKL